MLKVENIYVNLGGAPVLNGVSIEVKDGETVGLLGRNGAGKTTLLRSILRLIPIASGKIYYNGVDLTKKKGYEVPLLGIGYMPQGHRVFPRLTVLENLKMGALGISSLEFERRLEEIYDIFPVLKERRKQLAGTLSGGERMMLSIARALISDPTLLLMDEPSEGLMPALVDKVKEVVKGRKKKKGYSTLLVEQNIDVALEVCDRIYIMDKGCIKYEGRAEEISREVLLKHIGVIKG
jgi:branched-chain amino acid transport system ATP-binding protein